LMTKSKIIKDICYFTNDFSELFFKIMTLVFLTSLSIF